MQNRVFDLCWHIGQGPEAADWFIDFKRRLDAEGISVMAFSLNEETGKAWQKKGMNDFIVLTEYEGPVNVEEAVAFAARLGISNFRDLYFTMQTIYDLDEQFCQRKMASYIYSLQRLKDAPRANAYWTYGADGFDHNCLRLLSRMHNGRTIYSQPAVMEGRVSIFENENRCWQLPNGPLPEADDGEKAWLKKYIADYTGVKKILWGNPSDYDLKWEWGYLPRFLKRVKKSFRLRHIQPQSTNKYKAKQYVARAYRRYRAKSYYEDPAAFTGGEEHFVYFPLHFSRDSKLTLRGRPFMDQAAVVEIVSRYLPYPYTLLVKEHPHARGWLKLADIKKMASLPNVKFIHPFTNSHDIISTARGIVVINSSVGYEGILYRKPVITLGRSFYRGQGLTIDVGSLYELEQAFEKIETFIISEKEVLDFLWRIKYFSYPVNESSDTYAESIKRIVFVVKDYMGGNKFAVPQLNFNS